MARDVVKGPMARSLAQYGQGMQPPAGGYLFYPRRSGVGTWAVWRHINMHIKELYSRVIHYLYYAICTVCVSLALLLIEN